MAELPEADHLSATSHPSPHHRTVGGQVNATALAVLLVVACGAIGLSIPHVVTTDTPFPGAPQRHFARQGWFLGGCILAAAAIGCATLARLRVAGWNHLTSKLPVPQHRPSQRLLFLIVAVAMVFGIKYPTAATLAMGMVLVDALRNAMIYAERRVATLALMACLVLPFAWQFEHDRLAQPFASFMLSAPGDLPAAGVAALFGITDVDTHHRLALLITAVIIGLGRLVIPTGTKNALAYLILASAVSMIGSLNHFMRVQP